ncbi:MAG: cupin domain-containing protein [Candidatus Aminicenantes bacterium]|nr:cupin domain-containing protein [Candidatus Aminicenantes bacterium]
MADIQVEANPDEKRLSGLGVFRWEIWTKEVSRFPWRYDEQEICYFLEGDVTVIPDGGEPVRIGKGDLVTFPKGLSCVWEVNAPVRKRYRFGSASE